MITDKLGETGLSGTNIQQIVAHLRGSRKLDIIRALLHSDELAKEYSQKEKHSADHVHGSKCIISCGFAKPDEQNLDDLHDIRRTLDKNSLVDSPLHPQQTARNRQTKRPP